MKPDDEKLTEERRGRRTTVMKTTGLILIYYVRLKGGNMKWNREMGVFWGTLGCKPCSALIMFVL